MGLENLILIDNKRTKFFTDLPPDTYKYFQKLAGYETLRLILAKKAVLVEGPSDELVFQKIYRQENENKLPIEDGVDVISVQSLAFKRFLDIANLLNKNVAVITDNDGDFNVNITQKYNEYSGLAHILISADDRNALHTLEPQFFDVNKADLVKFRQVIGYPSTYTTSEEIIKYMINQKTDWALKLFESDEVLEYPTYIKAVVEWCKS